MKAMVRSVSVPALLLSVLLSIGGIGDTLTVEAGGPFFVTGRGEPFRWQRDPVSYTPDQGPLGQLGNSEAVQLVDDAFRVWQAVETATIRFEPQGQLDLDVTGTNIMQFLSRVPRGVSPIIFDHDGSIIDALAGEGASEDIIGFASPTLRPPITTRGEFRQGWAVFNGRFAGDRLPIGAFRVTLIHEFGHFIGLGHSQLNVMSALDRVRENDGTIPTMFPFLVSVHQAELHPDDIAAVSSIYPDPNFATSTGEIRGRVFMPNGVAGFQGANVVARRLGLQSVAVSSISGDLFTSNWRPGGRNGSADPALRGSYRITGLPPGLYTVEVEHIDPRFTGGSVVGPLDPPARLVGGGEFYSGEQESNQDGSRRIALVKVEAGSVLGGIDFILNGKFPANDLCLDAIRVDNDRFTDARDTRFAAADGDDPIHSCTIRTDANSVWYALTPERSGVVIADTLGSDYDTVLSAYTGACGDLVEAACNDDVSQNNVRSQIVFGAMAETTYLVEVASSGSMVGGGELQFASQFSPGSLLSEQEPNDSLAQAQEIALPGGVVGDIRPGDEGEISIDLRGRSEQLEDVYTFTLDRPAKVQINLAPESFGIGIDVVLFTSEESTLVVVGEGVSLLSGGIGPIDLPPGTYYIGVSVNDRLSGGNRVGYTLAIG